MSLQHEKLVAWQRADDLSIEIHRLTKDFPADERFELSSQARRAAYSVAANIVEGVARRSSKDRARFLNVAESSLAELGYCLHVARRLGYLDTVRYDALDLQVRRVGAPLVGLIRSL
jgi:four helix bundle protein